MVSDYIGFVAATAGIYATVAVSSDLLIGVAGVVSLAQASVFAMGAYAAAVLLSGAAPFPVAALAAMLAGILLAGCYGVLGARLRADDAVIGSVALQMIVFSLFNNSLAITGGPFGIPGVPQVQLFGYRVANGWPMAMLCWSVTALAWWVCHRVATAPLGRVLRAMREDELFATSLGKHPMYAKTMAGAVCGAFSGLAGALFASFAGFVDPTSFTLAESIFILSMVIVGGAGRLWGAIVGAALVIVAPELLRFADLPATGIGNIRRMLYGALLVGILIVRPQGLFGSYRFGEERR
jgi:branched-chain amino acid transport system permease protein